VHLLLSEYFLQQQEISSLELEENITFWTHSIFYMQCDLWIVLRGLHRFRRELQVIPLLGV